MSRSLRRLQRKQPDALKAMKNVGNLTKSLAETQNSLGNLLKVVQAADSGSGVPLTDETRQLVNALVEDAEALSKENEVQRETFLRLLIALSEDSEENIRKVESTLREEVLKERA